MASGGTVLGAAGDIGVFRPSRIGNRATSSAVWYDRRTTKGEPQSMKSKLVPLVDS